MNKKPVLFIRAAMFMGLAFMIGLTGPALAAQPDGVPIMMEILDRLKGVTQNWDKKLDSTNGDANGCNSDRFTCLFQDTAVRDNETGLVWDRDPFNTNLPGSWPEHIAHCANREVGGRKGWQLPMREQLASLIDTSNSNPALPTGHPFVNIYGGGLDSALLWTATIDVDFPSSGWLVKITNGEILSVLFLNETPRPWCVRGGELFGGN